MEHSICISLDPPSLKFHNRTDINLGIRRETVESEYKFLSDGKSLNFTLPWWPGSPNNNKNEFCCFANHNSLWDDNVCIGNDWYSICESNLK